MNRRFDTYKGYETWINSLFMNLKMHSRIFLSDLLLCLTLFCFIIYRIHGDYLAYLWHDITSSLLSLSFAEVEADLLGLRAFLISNRHIFTVVMLIVGIPYYWLAIRYFKWRSEKHQNEEYVSGSRLVPIRKIKEKLQKIKTSMPLGELEIPIDSETKHFLVVGRTGAGKTQVLKRVMTHLQSNSKIVCFDSKGDYLTTHYNPRRDLIFFPVDTRSVQWSLFNDVETNLDIQIISHSLIPDRLDGDPFWTTASRAVLRGVLHYAWRTAQRRKVENKYIWELLKSGAANLSKILKEIPEGQIGHTMIADPSSKQTQGVIANLLQDLAIIELMSYQDGDFSIKKWLHNPVPGTLFIANHSKSRDLLKPILTLLIDMASHEILSMDDDSNRRVYYFLDELGALHKMSSLIELLTRARSKGASLLLGIQEIGQITKEYGRELTSTIINNCGSKVILTVSEPDTERFISDMIGDVEIRETSQTNSMGLADLRDGISLAKNTRIKKLILPSSLQSLHELEAIVKFPNLDYTKTTIPYISYPKNHEYLILRKDMMLSSHTVNDSDFSWETVASTIWEDHKTPKRREF